MVRTFQTKNSRRRFALAACLVVALLGEVATLAKVDYSKGWLRRISIDESVHPKDRLKLDKLSWDPGPYLHHPQLAAFAGLVKSHCAGLTPLGTTVCLSNLLAARFAQGVARSELFDDDFSPVAVLRRHLDGETGHCVTRSGIIATALLASGFPARLVQLYPPRSLSSGGHNAVEVYDPEQGWVFFDPSFGGHLEVGTGVPQSAAMLVGRRRNLVWKQSGDLVRNADGSVSDGERAYAGTPPTLLAGHLVYPEPWLYTRIGRKQAPPPFNAYFLVVGPPSWRLTIGRWLLFGAIVLTLSSLAWVLYLAVHHRAKALAGKLIAFESTAASTSQS